MVCRRSLRFRKKERPRALGERGGVEVGRDAGIRTRDLLHPKQAR